MLQLERFVWELRSINRFASGPVTHCEITALDHKARNNSMERRTLVVQRFAFGAHSLFPGAQASEVLGGPWSDRVEELEHNTTDW